MIAKLERHVLTDQEWEQIAPLVPRKLKGGRPPRDAREMLDGMLWLLRSGAPWRDLSQEFGPWQTVYDYFNAWRRKGVLERIARRLRFELDKAGQIDWDLWCVDSTAVRAAKAASGASKRGARRSRKTTH